MTAESPRLQRLPYVEVLRGLCVTIVVLYHLDIPAFRYGFLGVDVFFVLSGYLMARLYGGMKSLDEARDYLSRRAFRLLPAYLVVTLACTAWAALWVLPHEFRFLVEHSIWATTLLPNVGYWMDNSYFDHTVFKPLLNLWSLGVELQFYAVFAVLVFAARRFAPTYAVVLIASLLAFVALHGVSPKTAFFQMPTRAWEFMAGVLCAQLHGRWAPPTWTNNIGMACLIAALVGMLIAMPMPMPEGRLYVPVVVTVILGSAIVSLGLPAWFMRSWLARFMETCGTYSYSIYLVHFPIIVFLNYEPFQGTRLSSDSATSLGLAIALTWVGAWALYRFVEVPWRAPRRLRGLGLAMAASAGLLVVFSAVAVPAFKALLPLEVYQVSTAMLDRDTYRCGQWRRISDPLPASCRLTSGVHDQTFLLVGDSHADAIKHVLAQVLEANGQDLRLMKQNLALGQITAQAIFDEAREQQVSTVVLHSSPGANDLATAAKLARLLASTSIRIIYLNPIPTPTQHLPLALYAAAVSGASPPSVKDVDLYNSENRDELAAVRAIADQHENFSVLATTTFLCAKVCDLRDPDGTLLFHDSHHLTLTGARRLGPVFRAMVEQP
jgi:peptidoglycan/LPS O-acetylase OafA/YrhL